MNNNSTQQSLS